MKSSHAGPHKYERLEVKESRVVDGRMRRVTVRHMYKCVLSGCPHYVLVPETILGNLSICHGTCGKAVILDRELMMLKKPMCDECREKRKELRRKLMEVGK